MKVHELIAQLQQQPRSATVYVQTADHDSGTPILTAVEGIDPATSPTYGTAVVIELED